MSVKRVNEIGPSRVSGVGLFTIIFDGGNRLWKTFEVCTPVKLLAIQIRLVHDFLCP
jgi:hypothetical protein